MHTAFASVEKLLVTQSERPVLREDSVKPEFLTSTENLKAIPACSLCQCFKKVKTQKTNFSRPAEDQLSI